ncbi:MAG: hypothetical protein AB7E66_16975, partial [Parvibaculaceae bacterium]
FGGADMPDAAEIERMQAELGKLDPNALPPELRDMAKAAAPASGGAGLPQLPPGGLPRLPGLGLPGLGNALPGLGGGFKGLPGMPGKKR